MSILTRGRALQIWSKYESIEGCDYGRLWDVAQGIAPRQPTRQTKRLQWIEGLLSEEAAEDWCHQAARDIDVLNNDQFVRRSFLFTVLKYLDPYLSSYFCSEYLPLFMRFYANKPEDKLPYAADWHCDAGPRKHLKALIYLSDSDEHGGNTAFLDYDTTMRFDEAGYLFCDLSQRKSDLSEIAGQYGIRYKPEMRWMRPGDCILFEPATCMHRAIWPTKGIRYMAQICFLPSPMKCAEACEQLDLPNYENNWVRFKVA